MNRKARRADTHISKLPAPAGQPIQIKLAVYNGRVVLILPRRLARVDFTVQEAMGIADGLNQAAGQIIRQAAGPKEVMRHEDRGPTPGSAV